MKNIEEYNFEFKKIVKILLESKMVIIKAIAIFFILGLIISFGSKKEYKASCMLLPESSESQKMNLGGLGNMMGLLGGIELGNISATGSTITPDLYPEIAKSLPFQLKILNKSIYFNKLDTPITPFHYFKEIYKPSLLGYIFKFTFGLPFEIKKWISVNNKNLEEQYYSNDEIIKISREDRRIIEKFKERITVEVDKKTSIITIIVEMPDPIAAAEVAYNSYEVLTEYVIDYKISKAQENLNFVQERYNESKDKFQRAQESLALFNDQNKNVVTAMAQTEQQRLQNEFDIAFDIFKGLSSQLEQAKIAVKEETPVVKILEPVTIPTEKSYPIIRLIMIVCVFLGFVSGIGYLFLKELIKTGQNSN
jgi:uncharacterized protein involved in exopolysaccharide biosynthesis